jgi:hypothetical protein
LWARRLEKTFLIFVADFYRRAACLVDHPGSNFAFDAVAVCLTCSPSSYFWGEAPCDDDPCGMNCLLCRSIFPLGVMAAFCSGVSLSVSTKPTAVKFCTQASTCRLASPAPTPRSSAEHSTISPVAGLIKRTFGGAVAHALRNRARMRTKRGMFSHSLSHVWKGKGSRPAGGRDLPARSLITLGP